MQYDTRQRYPVQKRRHSRRGWLAVALILVIATAGAAWWLLSDNNGKINPTNSTPRSVAPVADKTYASKYVSFRYKGGYKEKSRFDSSPGVEQVLLRANTVYEKTLAVEIQPLPPAGIGADTGYYYRQTHPDLYQSQDITVAGAAATEWVKKDDTERTVYLAHGNEYAILSFTIAGSNDVSGLPAEESALLSTFTWK